MSTITVNEIQNDGRSLLSRIASGERLTIVDHDYPIAEVTPIERQVGLRPYGLAKGGFVVPDDFDDPCRKTY